MATILFAGHVVGTSAEQPLMCTSHVNWGAILNKFHTLVWISAWNCWKEFVLQYGHIFFFDKRSLDLDEIAGSISRKPCPNRDRSPSTSLDKLNVLLLEPRPVFPEDKNSSTLVRPAGRRLINWIVDYLNFKITEKILVRIKIIYPNVFSSQ